MTPTQPTAASTTATTEVNANFIAPPQAGTVLDEHTKQTMVLAMSNQSGMNAEWSRQCLEETQWNFERAAFIFTELHKQNKIPEKAFVK